MKESQNVRYVLVSGGKAYDRRLSGAPVPAGEPRDEDADASPKDIPAFAEPCGRNGAAPAAFRGQHCGGTPPFPKEAAKRLKDAGAKGGGVPCRPRLEGGAQGRPEIGRKHHLIAKIETAVAGLSIPHKGDEGGKTRTFTPVKPQISREHLYEGGGAESIFTRRTKPQELRAVGVFQRLKMLVVQVLRAGLRGLGAVNRHRQGVYRHLARAGHRPDREPRPRPPLIYDGNGDVNTTFAGLENREWATSDEIPDLLKKRISFVSIEDVRFY
jgi:hypothetical protein